MKNDEYNKMRERTLVVLMASLLILPSVIAAADFDVNSFSCTPSEVVVGKVFSCTAQIKNNGDAAGTVSIATLYTDSNDWLEDLNYPQGSGVSVSPGQTTEVVFTGLRATKTGSNGFSKIMLDDVTDTYVSDQNIEENVINNIVTVENSVSSSTMDESFDVAAEVTAGGNIDVELTFSVNSGGCSIGSQDNPKSIAGMSDGSKQSRVWSVTQGTSGDCSYTISASATGTGGIASITDSSSNSVTCSDCPDEPSSSSSSSSSGGGGGAGASIGTTINNLGELGLDSIQSVELSANENVVFSISGTEHFLSVTNLTETIAVIIIKSEAQAFTLEIGDEINVDLTGDGMAELFVKLKSINLITNKAQFSLMRLSTEVAADSSDDTEEEQVEDGFETSSEQQILSSKIFIMILAVLLAVGAAYFLISRKR